MTHYRGASLPQDYPFLVMTLAKPNTVWRLQEAKERTTLAFGADWDLVQGKDGEATDFSVTWHYGRTVFIYHLDWLFLLQDENGGWILRRGKKIYKPEPAQPGDPLPPMKTSRARSPFPNTTWCRMDGKGKLHTLTINANGTVSDTAIPNEKPEWEPYDNGTVRYKGRRLLLDAQQKILLRENDKVREVWYSGRQPPKLGLIETKQLKETLANPSVEWVCWDGNKKTTYTFDAKSNNVRVVDDDGITQTIRWESLCAGCIRIGDEAFMVEGDTLERVEPRLTLKQEPIESVK